MKKIYLMVLCFIMISADIHAKSPEPNALSLDPIVVTASKAPKTAGNVTQQVDVISNEDISKITTGKNNIAELLQYQPGISVSVLSRNDANWGSSGGLSQKYNTFMLDGLPIDAYVEPQSLDPMAFERIEVQRGPASVLYPNYLSMDFAGNQSPLTGTTNIILKERIDESQTLLDTYFGSYKTFGGKFFRQEKSGNIHLFFGGNYESSDYTDYGTENSWLNMVDDPEYQKTKLYLKTTWLINDADDHKVSFFVNRTQHDGDTGRPNRDYNHEYWTVNTDYKIPLNKILSADFKVGFRKYDRTWEDDNYPTDLGLVSENGVNQEIVPADISASLKHGQGGLFTLGADLQNATYKTYSETTQKNIGNNADAFQYGFYFQEEYEYDSLIFRLGGRYADTEHDIDLLSGQEPGNDNQSWDKFLWSSGIKYNMLPKFSVYGNVGTSFVAPSLKSVGGTINIADKGVPGKDGHLPNPDLEPEEGMGYDLGMNFRPTANLHLGVRGFYNKIDDQIVQVVVSENPSQSQDINAGDTTSYGVELDARHHPVEWFGWFANYTFTDTEISNDNDPDQDGAEVPFVPEHMGNIGVDFMLPQDFTISLYMHLAGSIYDSTSKQNRTKFDSYELLNASVEKNLIQNDDGRLDVYFNLYNLTNNEYEMPWQFQDPGFSVVGGLRAVF